MEKNLAGGFEDDASKAGGFFGWGGCVGESILWRARYGFAVKIGIRG